MTEPWFKGRLAVLATMHSKEQVIAPVLEDALGLRVEVLRGIDTDRFGTFTREVPRPGSQRETARVKAEAALAAVPEADYGLASEGSFGPHPWLPWVAGGRELIVLTGRDGGLELVGADLTAETNHGSRLVGSVADALAFAQEIGFPTRGRHGGAQGGTGCVQRPDDDESPGSGGPGRARRRRSRAS